MIRHCCPHFLGLFGKQSICQNMSVSACLPPSPPHQTSMYHNQLKGTSRREENVNITSTHGDEMKKTIQGSE